MESRHIDLAKTLAAAALTCLAGCGDPPESVPSSRPNVAPDTARWSQVEQFRADLAAERHPSDGRGRVRLVSQPERVVASGVGRWSLELEVDGAGIAEGGMITFMPEPFWGWSTPQTQREDLPGFTTALVDREGVSLAGQTVGGAEAGLLFLTVEGGALVGGDVVTIDYGAGIAGARADRYAGREARLWVGVDGDGDGVRELIDDSPSIEVAPREPERLVLLGPSIARPGETVRYHVSALDGWANAAPEVDGVPWRATVQILSREPAMEAGEVEPQAIATTPAVIELDERGFAVFDVTAPDVSGAVVRLAANMALPDGTSATATSNPLLVDEDEPRVLWGDLHGHTGRSDGTGAVRDYFVYARDTARLDVLALTDHDHFGPRFLDASPAWWDEMRAINAELHEPGRFVTVPGFEWTNWVHGHRHVLFFDEADAALHSSIDEACDTPFELWDTLRGKRAMTLAHHSSGHPIPVNWTYPPDPELEPLTEIVSVHGSSEARDAPHVVAGSRDGQFVRDQLDRGYRLGFVGSGDSHDGHPGLPHLSPGYGWRPATMERGERMGTGGLAAIRTNELTRDGVLDALRARATYATSGPRIVALVDWGESQQTVSMEIHACAEIASVDLVLGPRRRADEHPEIVSTPVEGMSTYLELKVPKSAIRRYRYLRVVQVDGGTAWIGPAWPNGGSGR